MGIHGLSSFITNRLSKCVHNVYLKDFANLRIAIDFMGYLHSAVSIANTSTVLKSKNVVFSKHSDNQEENLTSILNSLKNYVKIFIDCNVMPVFVMDGKSPVLKTETRKNRQEDRKARLEKTEHLRNEIKESYVNGEVVSKEQIEELKKYEKHNFDISAYIQPARNLIESMGIPFIQSNTEAEKTCSMMCADGVVEAIFSKDSDCLTFGSPIIIRKFLKPQESNVKIEHYDAKNRSVSSTPQKINYKEDKNFVFCDNSNNSEEIEEKDIVVDEYEVFKKSTQSNGPICEIIVLSEILKEIEMSMLDFQKFCVMCGCDYNTDGQSSAIHRYGITTLYKNYTDVMDSISKKILDKIDSKTHKKFESRMDVVLMNIQNISEDKLKSLCEDYKIDINNISNAKIPDKIKITLENTIKICKSFDCIKMKECLELFEYRPWYKTAQIYDFENSDNSNNSEYKISEEDMLVDAMNKLEVSSGTNDTFIRELIEKYKVNNFAFLSKLNAFKTYYRIKN